MILKVSSSGASSSGRILGSLHKFGMGLILRRQKLPVTKMHIYFVRQSVWELLGMPLYMLQKDITSHIFSIICICGAAH